MNTLNQSSNRSDENGPAAIPQLPELSLDPSSPPTHTDENVRATAGLRQARPTFPCSDKQVHAPRVPLSPRRRRLRLTLILIGLVGLAGLTAGLVVHWMNQPPVYKPGESSADVTSELSRGLPSDRPEPRWVDVTAAAGLNVFRTFIGERTSQLPEDMGSGAAWGDFDADGDDDLFLVGTGAALNKPDLQRAPSLLFENVGGGQFRPFAGFDPLHIQGLGAAWGDYNGDGWLDLVVTGYNTILLLRNEHGQRFARDLQFPNPNGFWAGAAWADFDHDRDLDLYVCGYVQFEPDAANNSRISDQLGTFVPYTLNPASYPPEKNILFQNNGDATFTDVAEKLGVTNPTGRSLTALWWDFDGDGWLDLYVANDVSDNVLFQNQGGSFKDISHPAYVADYRSAMGLAAGDWNRDGDDDLFITHWVAQENALYDNLWADYNLIPATTGTPRPGLDPRHTATHPTPPTKETKTYPLRFMDIADRVGLGQIALPYVGWGTEFADVDNDGWLDLLVANGSTLEQEGPPPRQLKPQELFLFWNRRGEGFHNLAPLNAAFSKPHVSRGLAVSDCDNDGDLDFVVVHLDSGAQLFRNDMARGNWLEIRLRSRNQSGQPLGYGEGTTVVVSSGTTHQRRTVGSVSYLSQSSHSLHFGLGDKPSAERVEVRWHAGTTHIFTNLAANAVWTLTEDDPVPRRADSASSGPAQTGPARNRLDTAQPQDSKSRLIEFWKVQRAAMNTLKVDKNIPEAINLFRAALSFNPEHEDSRYYLAQCLADQGAINEALRHLSELTRINPQSHRGFQQWGALRALSATNRHELDAAEQALDRAHQLNPEETGALLLLGEVALLRGDLPTANQRFAAACQTNPKAVGGFFLRGYIAWKQGLPEAEQLLRATRQALGPDWHPKGATAEGDVKKKWHLQTSPLSKFWETWDGATDPAGAYAALDDYLARQSWP